ncbi:PTS transporter subunit EIIC [Nonomuraea glycinis]|uniref:PTS sugar transporter subunit IIA n=1 Tax=Nonomuraea glycinis TaxID=2047744 RepID=A0A918A6I0_9ACTN|nr:PTS transporter subunit EIIC [Nonomuraea glycinis]MCA2175944.1 PTS transporter subunit EIIC [Nonomuraea glycinis]WSG71787.1 PTS transporter subunit EIIC [Nonomuraea glycinis]GGP05702.1 PTS sugar transporter subunit IIA [Nonomuraea glycinis]
MNETTAARPSPFSRLMNVLQRLGRSLMLPIAALPAAALLLRFGQPDMLGSNGAAPGGLADVSGLAWMNQVAEVLAAAGAALFENLPLLFAVGVAIGFARKSDGTTALAAVVGYLVFDRVTKVMFFGSAIRETVVIKEAQAQGIIEIINYGMQNPTKVLGGIMMGLVTALLWQRFYRIKLPSWLAFFGGRRFVPIVTSFAALVLGVLIGWIWPTLGEWIGQAGEVLTTLGPLGTGLYGLINRLLIPLGLHHFVNSIVWHVVPQCEVGGRVLGGDWNCYFGGAPVSGQFMAGFFPIMMFALPAAALAMWRAAPAHRRATVGGIMLSAALASLVTGITEPIEFAFIFVAPLLLVVHAVLTGLAMALTTLIGGQLGFGFSAGLLDMLLNAGKSNTQNLPGILLIGLVYAVVYYVVFSFLIRRMNIMTPGREPEADVDSGEPRDP